MLPRPQTSERVISAFVTSRPQNGHRLETISSKIFEKNKKIEDFIFVEFERFGEF